MHTPMPTRSRHAAAWVAIVVAGAILLGAGPPTVPVMPAAMNLGAAAQFAVLAGGGVTDSGTSVISGNVGTHPLPAISGGLDKQAAGTVDRAGAASRQAQRDLASALVAGAALHADGTVNLAEHRTVPPGVYAIADGEQGSTAVLTLDGQDAASPVWIFVVAKDLATAPGSTITLVNGAQACNVFWLVGGSAVLAPGSVFAGSVLATASVTVGSDVTIAGRLLARTGAVALGGDTIRVPVCTPIAAKAAPLAAAGALALSSSSRAITAGRPSSLHPDLPIVMLALLAAAVVFAEPHHRRPRPARRRW